MLHQLRKLNSYHKAELLEQAQRVLEDWGEIGRPELVWDGYHWNCQCNNEDESVLVLYRCECGEYIAEQEEYGECGECQCGKNYDE